MCSHPDMTATYLKAYADVMFSRVILTLHTNSKASFSVKVNKPSSSDRRWLLCLLGLLVDHLFPSFSGPRVGTLLFPRLIHFRTCYNEIKSFILHHVAFVSNTNFK